MSGHPEHNLSHKKSVETLTHHASFSGGTQALCRCVDDVEHSLVRVPSEQMQEASSLPSSSHSKSALRAAPGTMEKTQALFPDDW